MMTKLKSVISEYSVRNKNDDDIPVYSVTNEQGFCTGYFSKDVSSKDRTTYKIVPYGCFAYNPSRINVGSVDWQHCEDKVIVSPLYVVFKVAECLDQRYLLHYLKSDIALTLIKANASGSVRDNLKLSVLQEFPINLRSIGEQRKIADDLDRVDHLMQLYQYEIATLDDLVKSRFIELFGDPVINDKGWVTDSVEKLCKEIYGGGTPSKLHPEYYENGNIPWVSSKDMKTDILVDSQIHINEDGVANSTVRMVPENSVIMVIRSGILKHTLPVAINAVPITVNQDLKVFIPGSRVITRFLAYQFKMLESDILSGVRAVTADNIEFDSLKKRKLIVPPMELQQQFAVFVAQVDKSKHLHQIAAYICRQAIKIYEQERMLCQILSS